MSRDGSAQTLVDGGCAGSCCLCQGVVADEGLVFDRGESSEGALAAAPVVGGFDPGDDRQAQFITGVPALTVQHVLLEQREERFHRSVVTG